MARQKRWREPSTFSVAPTLCAFSAKRASARSEEREWSAEEHRTFHVEGKAKGSVFIALEQEDQ
jgi:hypothetical protein